MRIVGGDRDGFLAIWSESAFEAFPLAANADKCEFGRKPGVGCDTIVLVAEMPEAQITGLGWETFG